MKKGSRGSRHDHVEQLIRKITERRPLWS
ncbi:MAG: hypothetical protein ACLUOI_38775 [Eisenbergiella sp.]